VRTDKQIENNYFNKIFVGVLILHIIFLYIIPGFSKIIIKEPEVSKITIGIINQEVESAPEKQETPKVVQKLPKEEPKKEVKKEVKKETPKEEPKKILTTTQSFDDLEVMTAIESPRTIPTEGVKEKPDIIKIEDKPLNAGTEKVDLNQVEDTNNENIDNKLEDVEAKNIDTVSNSIDITDSEDSVEDIKWDNMMSEENPAIIGPKTGLKVGAVDGKSKVVWDPSNKEPTYPIEAEKNAQTADVRIILDVDASGKVLQVRIIKTGVDVIDRAVESVARAWNVKLINSGMSVSGSVMVIYQFKLKGRE
jgi:protein TonB